MSWMRYMTLYSFRKLNPQWKIILHICNSSNIKHKTWNDSPTQDFFNYSGDNYFDKIKKLDVEIEEWNFEHEIGGDLCNKIGPSHMSNFFKWKLLSEKSGFYSDMDILYIKPIEVYYEKVKDFDTIICYNGHYFSIGFLGSSGKNGFFRSILNNTFQCCDPHGYQSAGVNNIYNLLENLEKPNKSIMSFNLWELIEKYFPDDKKYNNAMSLVYPWTCSMMAQVFAKENKNVPDDCIGIHWYAGARISQEYNNMLTESNYRKHNNTFTYFAEKIIQEV
ncbi:MAG: hypothetical protein ACTSU7_01835 [Candidatus Heimdallarchaeaceae archaeon]